MTIGQSRDSNSMAIEVPKQLSSIHCYESQILDVTFEAEGLRATLATRTASAHYTYHTAR
jgi:hypothetical protein